MDLGLRDFFLQRGCEAVHSSVCVWVFLSILVFHLHISSDLKTKLIFIILLMKHDQVQPKY